MAPEVWNFIPGAGSKYTTAVDLWALGCIVYRLACGRVPFPPGVSLMKFCDNQLPSVFLDVLLSRAGVEFLKRLLRPHPGSRMNATEAINHHWITGVTVPVEPPERSYTVTNSPEASAQDSTATVARTEVKGSGSAGMLYTTESTLDYNTATHAGLQSRRPSVYSKHSVGDQNSAVSRPGFRETTDDRSHSTRDTPRSDPPSRYDSPAAPSPIEAPASKPAATPASGGTYSQYKTPEDLAAYIKQQAEQRMAERFAALGIKAPTKPGETT
jgi:serine/threonine protein kinase